MHQDGELIRRVLPPLWLDADPQVLDNLKHDSAWIKQDRAGTLIVVEILALACFNRGNGRAIFKQSAEAQTFGEPLCKLLRCEKRRKIGDMVAHLRFFEANIGPT